MAFVAATLIAVVPSEAAPTPQLNLGGRDPLYGTNGRAHVALGRGAEWSNFFVTDNAGRALAVGGSVQPPPPDFATSQNEMATLTLTRLLPDGTLDSSFGADGIAVIWDDTSVDHQLHPYGVTVLPDDHIVVAVSRSVYTDQATDRRAAALLWLNDDGSIDASHGDGDGFVPVDAPSGKWGIPTALAAAGDRILVGGLFYDAFGRIQRYVTAVGADDEIDLTFGVGGFTVVPDIPRPLDELARIGDFHVRDDGNLLFAVERGGGNYVTRQLWMLLPDGIIDVTFGDLGRIDLDDEYMQPPTFGSLALHPSGEITTRAGAHFYRFLRNGAPDPSFGDNGVAPLPPWSGTLLTATGESVVMVSGGEAGWWTDDLHVVRIAPDGTRDDSVGVDGTADIDVSVLDRAVAVVPRPNTDGVLVLAHVDSGRGGDVAVIAVGPQGRTDPAFGHDGVTLLNTGTVGDASATTASPDGLGGLWVATAPDVATVVHLDALGRRIHAFGGDGIVTVERLGLISSLVPEPDGSVLLVGQEWVTSNFNEALAVRLLANGAVDPTFNGGAVAHLTGLDLPFDGTPVATRMLDGRYVIATNQRVQVLRADGHPDTTVGPSGVAPTGLQGRPAIAARGAGFVVTSIEPRLGDATRADVVIRAYSVPGIPDPTFGDGGTVRVAASGGFVNNVIVRPTSITVGTNHTVVRVRTADGSVDPLWTPPTFNATGLAAWGDIGVQSDDALIVNLGQEVRRYTASGAADPTFGDRGRILVGFGVDRWFTANRVVTVGMHSYFVGPLSDQQRPAFGSELGVVAIGGALPGGVPVVSIGDLHVTETDFGYWDVQSVRVSFDRPADAWGLTVDIQLFSRNGTAGVDAAPGDRQSRGLDPFDHTWTSIDFPVSIYGDDVAEPREQLDMRIVGTAFAIVSDSSGVLTIENNDPVAAPVLAATQPYGAFAGGAFVTTADVDGDGVEEIVTAPRAGGGPHVRVFRLSATNRLVPVAEFMAFDPAFTGGVTLAASDVDGDGTDEIVTAPASNGPPVVRVFHVANGGATRRASFLAYDAKVTTGLSVAGGDIDGDGREEIITAPQRGGGPHVRVFGFKQNGGTFVRTEFMAYETDFTGGVNVATSDTDGDDDAEVITAPGPGRRAVVYVWDLRDNRVISASAVGPYEPWFSGGVVVAGAAVDAYPAGDIITAPMPGAGPNVRIFRYHYQRGWLQWFSFNADGPSFGGVSVVAAQLAGGAPVDLVTTSGAGHATMLRVRRITY